MISKYTILFLFILCLTPLGAQKLPAVLPGDFPDPSVTKVGNTYWASATTSNWFPGFPLLRSSDLVHWTTSGHIFDTLPAWADYYFWAPELSYENGRMYVYYAAHKRGGNLCVAVASAGRPEGPYRDHGPLVCQEVGSIDGFPMRDENGKLYMIWKEDGNSVQKPTPIWAQPMNEERTALTGEKVEIFHNDMPWESNLVEGVAMIRHGGYYYAIYAAAGCCGRECTYATGVARSKNLLGPWEKYAKNPILAGDDTWKCPGHGSVTEKDGRFYFLYHAYDRKDDVYVGRQGLLRELKFTPDGWIEFLPDAQQVKMQDQKPARVTDEFSGSKLGMDWQWSVFQKPVYTLKSGVLTLPAQADNKSVFLGHKTFTTDYSAQTAVWLNQSNAAAGLALIGDDENLVGVSAEGGQLKISKWERGVETVVQTTPLPYKKKVHLKMDVRNGKDITFSYSAYGKTWKTLNAKPVDGAYLPPWDRAVRAGITSRGLPSEKAVFDRFLLVSGR